MANYLLSHTGAQIDEGIDVALRPAGYRNKLINGSLRVWQLGTSFTIPAGQWEWPADQIAIHNGTNQTLTVVASNAGSDFAPTMSLSFATAPTSGSIDIAPTIPNATTLQNGDVTLSYYCGTGEVLSITSEIIQNFGTGGSELVSTNLPGTVTPTSNLLRYSSTVALPSVIGKTFGVNHKLTPMLHIPIRTTNPFTLAMMQLECGKTATPFEMLSYEEELRRCLPFVQILDKVAVARFADTVVFGGSLTAVTYSPMHHAPSALLTHLDGSGAYATASAYGASSGHIAFTDPLPAVGSWEIFRVTLIARV